MVNISTTKKDSKILWRNSLRLQLHGAIYRPNSFVLMSRHCAKLKAIRYESTSLDRIVADKSHSVIVALHFYHRYIGLPTFIWLFLLCAQSFKSCHECSILTDPPPPLKCLKLHFHGSFRLYSRVSFMLIYKV